MQPDIDQDFAEITDALESVELERHDSGQTVEALAAWRQEEDTRETEPSGGVALAADAVWHVQLVNNAVPYVGDVLVDVAGNRWTILIAEALPLLKRWKCSTRELRIAACCHDLVDLQRPVWEDNGSGPEIVGWNDVATTVPARIQPDVVQVSEGSDPPEGTTYFRIVLGEQLPILPGDRIVDDVGTIYWLVTYEQSHRIDTLPVAHVWREE